MALYADDRTIKTIEQLGLTGFTVDDIVPLFIRGLAPDFDDNGNVIEDGEGTRAFKEYMKNYSSGRQRMSIVGKISAITLDESTPYEDSKFADENDLSNYRNKFDSWQSLCSIFTNVPGKEKIATDSMRLPGYEYYPDDFIYCTYNGYPINRLITLRRFPFPCTDNIWDMRVQANQDVTRMITYFDDNNNKLDELLSFNYGMKWKQLEAGFEAMRMSGDANNEGLTGFMNKAATAFGDEELIKNRLRGPNGNQIAPDEDTNKAHGPVDSITSTHIRDVGLDFEKEFSIDFYYTSRSFGGRNPDAVMKDLLANALLCTFNDGEFWGGARYWLGQRPSKSLNMLQWMNSDDTDTILKGVWNTLNDLVSTSFGSKESAIETLKNVIKGGIQMAMAGIMNAMGRPGVPFANSLLSGSPVGSWHLTIGHPMNPIMTIGNLICTGVDVKFPNDTLSYGDFPTAMTITVKLKPAMPLDRAGIEKIFNHGMKRIYMPTVVPVIKGKGDGRHRSLIDICIDKVFVPENLTEEAKSKYDYAVNTLAASVQQVTKWASDRGQEVWVRTEDFRNSMKEKGEEAGEFIKTKSTRIIEKGESAYDSAKAKVTETTEDIYKKANDAYQKYSGELLK